MLESSYGFVRTLPNTNLQRARERITEALAKEGFGVLTEIDVKATLKKKIDVDFRPYIILGACNPKLAHQALSGEPAVGLLLPCNVVISETDDGHSEVAVVDPEAMFAVVRSERLSEIAAQVKAKLQSALAAA